MDGSDLKRDPKVVTHTTTGISSTCTNNIISTQTLLINLTIKVVIGPINPIVTTGVVGAQDSLNPRQTVLPQVNITNAARSCAGIYWNPGKVSRTESDGAMPRDASSSQFNSILSLQSSIFVVTSFSPSQSRD